MLICLPCKKQMKVVKNGVTLHYGNGHCHSSDTFRCPTCGTEIANANPNSWQSSKWEKLQDKPSDIWINMPVEP